MNNNSMRRAALTASTAALLFAISVTGMSCGSASSPKEAVKTEQVCAPGNGGLSLPPGFCATIFADNLGHARHMAVAADGTLYVNTWSGRYYRNSPPPKGGFLIALRDTNGDGVADDVHRFGDTPEQGSAGGTGIALYKGALYAEMNDRIIRFALTPGSPVPSGPATTILSGMPLTGDHPMHPFVIDQTGQLFVNSGSPSNACELKNRMPNSPGHEPCTQLETRAGIWLYDANKADQHFSPAERYATGIRNSGGQAFDSAGRLFATQHGRDQLSQNWPSLYRPEQGPELPAEELLQVSKGDDFGWPYCYYDGFQKKLVLAPEYGGDGKNVGQCADKKGPVAAFPAHWAPNGLLIYGGQSFPNAYRGGAFIAFHGSWNRAPAPQDGYNVVFQPLADGQASGQYILFADGFAGAVKDPGQAQFRPSGLAMGPDGALYISDDVHGRIWRVTYKGAADAALTAAPPAKTGEAAAKPAQPPEGTHPDADRKPVALTPPPGFTKEQVALGDRIYHGEERGGTCSGCHGADGRGSSVGPGLVTSHWLWGDGSVASIAKVVKEGVANPKQSTGAMPPLGGAALSDADVQAVSAYVWALNHK